MKFIVDNCVYHAGLLAHIPISLQGMCAIIPGMLIIGFSSSSYMLYSGLFLYCVGKYHVLTFKIYMHLSSSKYMISLL